MFQRSFSLIQIESIFNKQRLERDEKTLEENISKSFMLLFKACASLSTVEINNDPSAVRINLSESRWILLFQRYGSI